MIGSMFFCLLCFRALVCSVLSLDLVYDFRCWFGLRRVRPVAEHLSCCVFVVGFSLVCVLLSPNQNVGSQFSNKHLILILIFLCASLI